MVKVKKKRGRPLGSKNKKKTEPKIEEPKVKTVVWDDEPGVITTPTEGE
jgi:hypothetical protein